MALSNRVDPPKKTAAFFQRDSLWDLPWVRSFIVPLRFLQLSISHTKKRSYNHEKNRWLVVSNMTFIFHHMNGQSFPLTNSMIFQDGHIAPPTRSLIMMSDCCKATWCKPTQSWLYFCSEKRGSLAGTMGHHLVGTAAPRRYALHAPALLLPRHRVMAKVIHQVEKSLN